MHHVLFVTIDLIGSEPHGEEKLEDDKKEVALNVQVSCHTDTFIKSQ